MTRYGMTIPFDGVPLVDQKELVQELARLGYTDAWSAEADGFDGLTPLALASVWAPTLRLGTAILPAFTRAPALMAQSAAALAAAAPGRVAIGIGASSDVIVERWNGIAFEDPYGRVRDMVRFLRAAFTGEKISLEYPSFRINGFRLRAMPPEPPKILVAALRSGMLRLAGREADGAIVNWLSADDVSTVAPHVQEGGDDKEIAARIFVAPSTDRDAVLGVGRFAIAAYLNVPVYRAFHEWLGRGQILGPMWEKWTAGDRAGAVEAIPSSLVDELIVSGTPEECRAHIQRYVDNGVTTPVIALMPVGVPVTDAIRYLAPDSSSSP